MKNVLLPTDLTLQSLYPIHHICKLANGEKCNIHVIHTLDMPTGIMDLLFLQDKKPYKLLPPGFLEGFEVMRRKYGNVINRLSFEFVWGNSRAYLENFMHARGIESIYLLKDYEYGRGLADSFNCIPLLLKCKVPVNYASKAYQEEYATLTALLYREEKMHA